MEPLEPPEHPISIVLKGIENDQCRQDSKELIKLIYDEVGVLPKMWGTSIIGFGSYHYKYASGHEGDTAIVGFAARKQALVVYGLIDYEQNKHIEQLVKKLGPVKLGKGCLYIKRLSDVNKPVLRHMINEAWQSKQADIPG